MRLGHHLGDHLSAFVDGELPPERGAHIRAHLAACCRCADRVAEERQVRGVLTAATGPELPPWLGIALRDLPTSGAQSRTASIPPTAAPAWRAAPGLWGESPRGRRVQVRLGTVLAGVAVVAVVGAGVLATGAVMGRTVPSPPVPLARFSTEQDLLARLVTTTGTARAASTPSTDLPRMPSEPPAATVKQPGDAGSGR